MEKMNSYFGRAKSDYLYAKAGMCVGKEYGDYNGVASLCAQAGEKYLKAVLEVCFVEDTEVESLMHSKSFRALYKKVVEKFSLSTSAEEYKWLCDFYFDARYPGNDFVVVNEQDAEKCLRIVESLEQDVRVILTEDDEERRARRECLEKFWAFR